MTNIDHRSRCSVHSHVDRAGCYLTEVNDQFISGCQSNILIGICLVWNNCSEVGSGSYLRFIFGIIVGICADRFSLKLVGNADKPCL